MNHVLNKRVRRVHVEPVTSVRDVTMSGRTASVPAGPTVYERTNRMKPRTAELLTAIRQLDVTVDQHATRQIMEWIRNEYDARQGGTLLGLFAKCYLGPPYVDHRLDLFGSICEHFTPAEQVPIPYAQARGLAQSGAYAHIEIYTDGAMVPVLPDGTAVEMSI